MGDERQRAVVGGQRGLELSIAGRSRWLVGSSGTSQFAPPAISSARLARVHSPAERLRAARPPAAGAPGFFSGLLAATHAGRSAGRWRDGRGAPCVHGRLPPHPHPLRPGRRGHHARPPRVRLRPARVERDDRQAPGRDRPLRERGRRRGRRALRRRAGAAALRPRRRAQRRRHRRRRRRPRDRPVGDARRARRRLRPHRARAGRRDVGRRRPGDRAAGARRRRAASSPRPAWPAWRSAAASPTSAGATG